MSVDHDVPAFGYLPFDHFVMAAWNPSSPLSKQDQKASLVEQWIRLGKYGREEYLQRIPDEEDIPAHVPRDLLSDKERSVNGQISKTLFIRTWFGHRDDVASQDAADAAYRKLLVYVMQQADPASPPDHDDIEDFIFDDREELFYESPDVVDGVALGTPGSVPSYLLAALMHCPDQLHGCSVEGEYNLSPMEVERVTRRQNLLVLVADRTACETGWVLHLGIGHKGQVLPFRVRDAATRVTYMIGNWFEGEALSAMSADPDEDVEFYISGGDGWDI